MPERSERTLERPPEAGSLRVEGAAMTTHARTVPSPSVQRSAVASTVGILILAVIGTLAFAIANSAWADWIQARLATTSDLVNGLAFSAFPFVIGAVVVAFNPRAFGIQLGTTLDRWRLILLLTFAMCVFAAAALTLVGSSPFRGAEPIVQVVAVPVSEELVFRGVLFTLVLGALRRVHAPGRALWLAVVISGVAFGIGHLNNLGSYDATFVVAQAAYASVLGVAGGWLRASTSSILPPVLMHAAVNLVALYF
jgi:membrane protease YdiL (CAAX protease family)